ncbi:MAG: sigma-70 family RNA polymerase sigma factor [Tannerellaceae bacterium]|nr:sigma-70 family RNA polymerase sigma factor [Tannerellaceae bacterium]
MEEQIHNFEDIYLTYFSRMKSFARVYILNEEEQYQTLQISLNSLQALNEDIFSTTEVQKVIEKALDTLSDRCRKIFIMSKIEGKKQKEIAEELNITVNTVQTQMGIAYKKLRTELKKYFF